MSKIYPDEEYMDREILPSQVATDFIQLVEKYKQYKKNKKNCNNKINFERMV